MKLWTLTGLSGTLIEYRETMTGADFHEGIAIVLRDFPTVSDAPYSTHILQSDDAGNVSAFHGNYDLTHAQARDDFVRRLNGI